MHVQAASMKHMRIAIKHMSILPLNLSPHLLAIFAVQELASRCQDSLNTRSLFFFQNQAEASRTYASFPSICFLSFDPPTSINLKMPCLKENIIITMELKIYLC